MYLGLDQIEIYKINKESTNQTHNQETTLNMLTDIKYSTDKQTSSSSIHAQTSITNANIDIQTTNDETQTFTTIHTVRYSTISTHLFDISTSDQMQHTQYEDTINDITNIYTTTEK